MKNESVMRLLKETEHDIAVKRTELNDLEALARMLRRQAAGEAKLEAVQVLPSIDAPRRPSTPLSDFIIGFLGPGPRSFAEVKQAADKAGLTAFTKHPGQTVNMALSGLKHKGFADNDSGKWRLTGPSIDAEIEVSKQARFPSVL